MALIRANTSGGGGASNRFCEYYATVPSGNQFQIDVGFHPIKVITYALYGTADMYSVYDENVSTTTARKAQSDASSKFTTYPLKSTSYANIYSVEGNIVTIETKNNYSKLYICAWRD